MNMEVRNAIRKFETDESICRRRDRKQIFDNEAFKQEKIKYRLRNQYIMLHLTSQSAKAKEIATRLKMEFDYDVTKLVRMPFTYRIMFDKSVKMLEVTDKYDRFFYDISTPRKFARVMLTILDERYREGYWYSSSVEDDKNSDIDPNQIDMFKAPKKSPAEIAKGILDLYTGPKTLLWAGLNAYGFLDERAVNEYEKIEIQRYIQLTTNFE